MTGAAGPARLRQQKQDELSGRTDVHQGRVVYGAIEEVVFGHPAAEAIVAQMDRLGTRRAFLMVSGTLNRQTDEITKIRTALGARCAGLFDAMPAHTPREAVIAATNAARDVNADLIVTVGGGSITDGAKAVQLCLANGIDDIEGIERIRVHKGVAPEMAAPTVRQISVPTTIAGGEFSSIAGVTNRRIHVKEMLRHPLTVPRATILDPAITVHTPEWLFLSTGIRAVDHCVEAICSRETHPYADAQSVKGLAMLADALPRVKANPSDLDARMDAQIGTWLSMGALAAGVPMGASHGIGYVLGAAFDVPHGHTSCIMLPAVMRWNARDTADRQMVVAAAMGYPNQDAADVLDAFIRALGMPRSLSDVRVSPEHFNAIAEAAMRTNWIPRNPRKIEGPADVREILQLAA
nr:iron-containing alcohol dehydrogenase [Bradyrhizobium diazoefficiens]